MTRVRLVIGLGFSAALALGWVVRPTQVPSAVPLLPPDRLLGGGTVPVAFCFAPGTDPAVMAHYNEIMQTDPEGTRYQLAGRWSGGQGTPRALTWSLVPDGLAMEGSTSDLFSRMDTLYAAQGGRATWVGRIQACFDRWAQLTGTSYTRITSGGNDWDDGTAWGTGGGAGRGDIRIGMILIDGPGNVLAYNYYPSNGDMVLDRGDNYGNINNGNRFLRNIVMHEHGHGLGIAHVCSSDSSHLMEPFLNTSFDGPRDDDVRGAQRHYGDNFESNDSPAAATNLGTREVGPALNLGAPPPPTIDFASMLSIDGDGKQDYFKFALTGDRLATIAITPIGRTYDNSSQNGDGSCNSGNPVNSLTAANLNVQLLAGDGSTVLVTRAAQPAGIVESIFNVPLGAGDYYFRVYEEGAPSQAQFYSVYVSVAYRDCNFNGVGDPCELSCGEVGGICDVPGCGLGSDCNASGTPDNCEPPLPDCDANSIPDACELAGADCNSNAVVDACDINGGTSQDANGNATPDECEPAPFAVVASVVSRRACDVSLGLSPVVSSEPRQGGVSQLRIAFQVPPGSPGPGAVVVEEKQCPSPGTYVPYAGAAAITPSIVGGDLVLDFSPALENQRTYRVTLGSSITTAPGQFVEVRSLVADVNSDGEVNGLDRSVVVGAWTGGGFTCETDINGDGATNALDRSVVVGSWTGGANCSP